MIVCPALDDDTDADERTDPGMAIIPRCHSCQYVMCVCDVDDDEPGITRERVM
jgi:hypothetical protein